ncbi:MAG TPA: hypothetical protein VLM76_06565 [Patescibacteria group bacterium]|nr:hypothetical protein [Patescibacteria group bacterium]
MEADVLVRDYLGRLEAAAWRLAVERRAELVAEVREHIETALTELGRRDEMTVRNVLERLGPPEEIVAAEGEPAAAAPTLAAAPQTGSIVARPPWGAVEVLALLLLTVGAVLLPFVGPLAGLAFVWLSARWTQRQKLVVTVIVLVLLALPLLVLFPLLARAVEVVQVQESLMESVPVSQLVPVVPLAGIGPAILGVVDLRRRRP